MAPGVTVKETQALVFFSDRDRVNDSHSTNGAYLSSKYHLLGGLNNWLKALTSREIVSPIHGRHDWSKTHTVQTASMKKIFFCLAS